MELQKGRILTKLNLNFPEISAFNSKLYSIGVKGDQKSSSDDNIIGYLKTKKVFLAEGGFLWRDEYNGVAYNDFKSTYKRPQGISFANFTDTDGTPNTIIVVSWYTTDIYSLEKDRNIFRLSFYNKNLNKYVHILPVKKSIDDTFELIKTHAGGISVNGKYLYVADSSLEHTNPIEADVYTKGGIRVFDITKIFETKDFSGVVIKDLSSDVKEALDFNDRIIIQQEQYEMVMPSNTIAKAAKFSYCSLDFSTPDSPKLITGNFHSTIDEKYNNTPPQISFWNLEGNRITDFDKYIDLSNSNTRVNVTRTQGAIVYKDKLILNRSYANASSDNLTNEIMMFKISANNELTQIAGKKHNWAIGCEDLSYDLENDLLYGLTEFKYKRFVFWCKLSNILDANKWKIKTTY